MYKLPFVVAALSLAPVGRGPAFAAEQAVFPMEEVSVFKEAQENKTLSRRLLAGQSGFCRSEPSEEVRKYPKLNSRQPLYGAVTFDSSYFQPNGGVEFQFVIDESGGTQAKAEKPKESPSLLERLAGSLFGGADARAGEGDYDRLYFDANGDLDLTNDPVTTLMKAPPAGALSPDEQEVNTNIRVFDYLEVAFDQGPDAGPQRLRMLPKLWTYGRGFGRIAFVPTAARKGDIRIGHHEYSAVLAQSGMVSGRFDRPFTSLYLTPRDDSAEPRFPMGAEWLSMMREVDGELFSITATPSGDKLIVTPYRGDFGTFEVGPGGRKVENLGARGLLLSKDNHLVSVGDMASPYAGKGERRKRLPVGDYWPLYLSVQFGKLEISFSPNRYSEGGDEQAEKKLVHGIAIRKDKPHMLELTDKPSVLFTSPKTGETFKPGEEIDIEAMLIDRTRDLMITDIKDTTRKEREIDFTDENGKPVKFPIYASLDPAVTITNAAGKVVASGKMPFG